jgi:hypothetical protein
MLASRLSKGDLLGGRITSNNKHEIAGTQVAKQSDERMRAWVPA